MATSRPECRSYFTTKENQKQQFHNKSVVFLACHTYPYFYLYLLVTSRRVLVI